MILTIHLYY